MVAITKALMELSRSASDSMYLLKRKSKGDGVSIFYEICLYETSSAYFDGSLANLVLIS